MNTQGPHYEFGELYIAGQWRVGASGRPTEVPSPWSGKAVATLTDATVSDVDDAYDGAARA